MPENRSLLDVNISNHSSPVDLETFVKNRKVFHTERKTRLMVHWREYLHTEI
jgi:hypothetical protein